MTEKLALVTGASRGLGSALAELLTPEHHVIAVGRTVGGLEDLDDRIKARGGQATLAPLDITDDDAMQHLCRSIHDRWGGLSLWVHAAIHAAPLSPVPFISDSDWDKSLAINVTGTRRLIAYVAPLLEAHEGRAVFFDDPRAGQKFFGSYGTSKAAQMAVVDSWRAETANTGPESRVLTPPPMPTATRARFFPGEDKGGLTGPREAAAQLLPEIL